MNVGLIELLLGIYFIGVGVSIIKVGPQNGNVTVDMFKLLLGIILVFLALAKGVTL